MYKIINLNNRLDDSILEQVEIDDNLAQQLMMQDETLETHQALNFDQRDLIIKTLKNNTVENTKRDFG